MATFVLQSRTLTLQAYETIKRRIIDHSIKPGSRLIVAKLAKDLGVSQSPVRETLRLLEKDGLVSMHPHRGAVATVVEREAFRELLTVRRELEALAVRLTCQCLEQEALQAMEKILQETEAAADPDRWQELDDEFHGFFTERCGNRVLSQILGQLHDSIAVYRHFTMRFPEYNREGLAQHRKVCTCMKAGDGEGAAAAMVEHIVQSLRLGLKRFDSEFTSVFPNGG